MLSHTQKVKTLQLQVNYFQNSYTAQLNKTIEFKSPEEQLSFLAGLAAAEHLHQHAFLGSVMRKDRW